MRCSRDGRFRRYRGGDDHEDLDALFDRLIAAYETNDRDEAADTYDRVILFFLLHEMPLDVRRRTLAEAVRVLKPGQELVIVDYHRPVGWHPLKPVMTFILRNFEPFAMDLWNHHWLPLAVVFQKMVGDRIDGSSGMSGSGSSSSSCSTRLKSPTAAPDANRC